jgi:hypothetical protein
MQIRATLRNELRRQNYELPSVSNDMQSSETLRNSLGLNYKSAALPTELCRHLRGKIAGFFLFSTAIVPVICTRWLEIERERHLSPLFG